MALPPNMPGVVAGVAKGVSVVLGAKPDILYPDCALPVNVPLSHILKIWPITTGLCSMLIAECQYGVTVMVGVGGTVGVLAEELQGSSGTGGCGHITGEGPRFVPMPRYSVILTSNPARLQPWNFIFNWPHDTATFSSTRS